MNSAPITETDHGRGKGERAPVTATQLAAVLTADRPRLVAVATRILGDRGAAEDAVQDASIRALRGVGRFRGGSSIATWLHRIVVNTCLDELRRRRPETVPLDPDRTQSDVDAAGVVTSRLHVDALLAGLSPAHRQVVVAIHVYGLDYAAASAIIGVPPGTVASRLARSRAILRAAELQRAA